MPKITPFLWFDNEAESAAKFYCSVFKNSRIKEVSHYREGMPKPAGTVMTVNFELDGQEFIALNGGPEFKFDEAISFAVRCETQQEVDDYWDKLTAGGEESMCGWLKDKYGLSWQITPSAIYETVGGPDPAGAQRATEAMLQMKKLDINKLRQAYAGHPAAAR